MKYGEGGREEPGHAQKGVGTLFQKIASFKTQKYHGLSKYHSGCCTEKKVKVKRPQQLPKQVMMVTSTNMIDTNIGHFYEVKMTGYP